MRKPVMKLNAFLSDSLASLTCCLFCAMTPRVGQTHWAMAGRRLLSANPAQQRTSEALAPPRVCSLPTKWAIALSLQRAVEPSSKAGTFPKNLDSNSAVLSLYPEIAATALILSARKLSAYEYNLPISVR